MDPASPTGCCNCGCPCCFEPSSPTFRRYVKRKADGRDAMPQAGFARVELENELTALRETLASQQVAIQELSVELEEERNAAATAASETMSMILRLQREKAEVQMEARQFRRFAEEKMAHDGREIAELDDLLFKREQQAQALSCEVRAYKDRLLSLGINVGSDPVFFNSDGNEGELDLPRGECYPPLRCVAAVSCDDDDTSNLERRIYELEKTPYGAQVNIPNPPQGHLHRFSSVDSLRPQESSAMVGENGEGEDDETDRIYTIDAVHGVTLVDESEDEELISSRMKKESDQKGGFDGGEREEGDINKLYMRLQALEADRESMRQAIISMRTEKAQIVLLREIAQQLCKEAKPEMNVVKKNPTLFGAFTFVSLIKWVMPFLFWRKKASRSRYTFGLSNSNVGLLLILDNSPQMGQWRCLTRTTPRR
ncbi:myosin-binding protein 7 [Dendrobium catenatum]|uniref:GTD-binding domain-containing protein n=1 Tax=Dendrobium catenatum TaxID=906689 RepID=A0A2I0X3H9_9ASPA|nr:myosin-binding protein 7 [Dendrobium catenatum]PKU82460.1 hypothetical protein MA16_Dca005465 [Dendrobium catenatum]